MKQSLISSGPNGNWRYTRSYELKDGVRKPKTIWLSREKSLAERKAAALDFAWRLEIATDSKGKKERRNRL